MNANISEREVEQFHRRLVVRERTPGFDDLAQASMQAFDCVVNRYEDRGARSSGWDCLVLAYGVTIRDEGHREHVGGQADR